MQNIQAVEYDVLDVDATQFDEDFFNFRMSVKELERRLSSIIMQAFDDCTTLTSTFKLLDSFEGLLDRQVIAEDMDKKQQQLMRSYHGDVREALEIFNLSKRKPNMAPNSAPFSGSVAWVRGLKERVQLPMGKLRETYKTFLESEIGRELESLHDSALAQMQEFEDQMIKDWVAQVGCRWCCVLRCFLLYALLPMM